MRHKKACTQFAEDKQTKAMGYWNHVLWSDETKINVFGSDGVKRVWRQPGEEYKDKRVLPKVKHGGGSVMVWGCMGAAGTGELQLIEGTMNANMYCDILKQSMIPSLQRLGRRAVFQHDNDPKQNIDTLGPIWTFSLRSVLTFVASVLDINGCVLSYFEGTADLHCYTSCTLTALHWSKVALLQCCHMNSYNTIFTKNVRSVLYIYIYIYIYR